MARRSKRLSRALATFYWKAYEDNITGLSGMVAYNLLLSVFPLALVALFIAGQGAVLAASSSRACSRTSSRCSPTPPTPRC